MYRAEILANPVPQQMFELAAIAVCLAKEQDKLRESSGSNNAQLFVPEMQEKLIVDKDRYVAVTHMFAGRVARSGYARHRTWRLRLAEKVWIESDEGEMGATRTTYDFEWNNERVIAARRSIRSSAKEEDEVYHPESIPIDYSEIAPDWLNARQELSTVSQGDCAGLIKELRLFSRAAQQPQLQYNR